MLSGRGMIETILARGDARVGELLLEVFRRGEIFTAWDAHFHFPVWEEALDVLAGADFLSELPLDTELPWDFIELNFHKRYLADEYRRSRAGEPTRSCAGQDCADCARLRFRPKGIRARGLGRRGWAGGPSPRPVTGGCAFFTKKKTTCASCRTWR